MTRVMPAKDSGDILKAMAFVHGTVRQLALPEAQRMGVFAALLGAASRALQSGGSIGMRADGASLELLSVGNAGQQEVFMTLPLQEGAEPDLPAEPDVSAALDEVSKTIRDAAASIESNQRLVASMESEIEETNRGVMALYAELDDRADKLRRADELKSRFLSYASHELRTPLNGIVGLVRLLRSSAATRSPDDLKQLAFIQKAAEEMREMVNDLLDLAKVEAGKVTVQPSEFDLGFVFGSLRGIFRPLLHTEDVTLTFEDTSAVPAIYSDEGKVSQILRNLLSNALKFTERGGVRVWADAKNDLVRIMVADTGIGIPADQLTRIFEEFTQVDNPLQRRVRGTGLGLPLCRKLASLLGGTLTAKSTLGQGSVFTLTLPRTYQVTRSQLEIDLSEPKPRSRASVLIIDDVEIDRYLLSHLITASGDYDIIQAEDGQMGLDVARRERPDLIFLDLNLPRMDGVAVATELVADPMTKDIPVFIVTAEKLDETQHERLRLLTRGVILKERLSEAQRVQINLTAPAQVTVS